MRREIERRRYELVRNALVGVLGVAIIVALVQGTTAFLPHSAGGISGPVFLSCFFAITGGSGQIGKMRKDRTVIHMMTARAPRKFIASTLVVDALFSLPFLGLAVLLQSYASHGASELARDLAAAGLAYIICMPIAWLWCCHVFSSGNLSTATPLAMAIATFASAIVIHFAEPGISLINGGATVEAALATVPVWVWFGLAVGTLAAAAASELLLTWWRQGGDIFA